MVRINSLKKVSLILSLALVGMACTTTPKNTEETMESLTQYVEPRIGTLIAVGFILLRVRCHLD